MKKRFLSVPSSEGLMQSRFFAPFFWAQAASAFNDNFFKQILLLSVTYVAVPDKGWNAGFVNNLAAALFILPFMLFSATGGVLADSMEKTRLIRLLKWVELVAMCLAAVMLLVHAYIPLLALLLVAGIQAALFGPVKYAILPQHVPGGLLVSANAWIEMGTFLAILLGTLLAGGLFSSSGGASLLMGGGMIVVSLIGLLSAYRIPEAPPKHYSPIKWQPFKQSVDVMRSVWKQPLLFRAVLGISLFWLLGTSYLTQLPLWAATIAHGDSATVSFMLAAFALGIGVGALWCSRLSAGRTEVGIVPFGALIIGFAGFDFAHHNAFIHNDHIRALGELVGHWRIWWCFIDLALVGVGGGLYIIPLYMILQTRSARHERSRVIAANNIMNAVFMILATGLGVLVLSVMGASINVFFSLIAFIAWVMCVAILIKNPRPGIRICMFIALRCCYRLRLSGRQNIPSEGAALVVCNHVSYMDALLLGGTSPRLLRFMMDAPAYESPWLNWFCRLAGAIPVDLSKRNPKDVRRALNEVSAALRNGDVVMVFPEGRLTRDGEVGDFRRGIEKMLAQDPVPVIPAATSGLWGSWGSYKAGKPFMRWPTRLRRRVRIGFGAPIDPRTLDRFELRRRVIELKKELGGGK